MRRFEFWWYRTTRKVAAHRRSGAPFEIDVERYFPYPWGRNCDFILRLMHDRFAWKLLTTRPVQYFVWRASFNNQISRDHTRRHACMAYSLTSVGAVRRNLSRSSVTERPTVIVPTPKVFYALIFRCSIRSICKKGNGVWSCAMKAAPVAVLQFTKKRLLV